jgi:hypothetical protein
MLTDEDELRLEEEHKISKKVIKLLALEPLYYTYKRHADDKLREGKSHMRICVSEFFDSLDARKNVAATLKKTALKGPCKFKWRSPYMNYVKKPKSIKVENPTWAELFTIANRAFLEGQSPDHCFFEAFKFDATEDAFVFYFGS